MFSNGNWAQRRSCSRREPSKLVRRQSKSGLRDSCFGIVFQPHAQMFDIYSVLLSARRFLHFNQRGDADKANFYGPIQRFHKRSGVFFIKRKGLIGKYVNRCLTVAVAPELQHLHTLIAYPALARSSIGKLLRCDRRQWFVAKRRESSKGPFDIVRYQLDDNVGVLGKAEIPMGVHRKAAGDQIAYAGLVERADDRFEAGQCHGASSYTAGDSKLRLSASRLARMSAARRIASRYARRKGPRSSRSLIIRSAHETLPINGSCSP